MKDLDEFMNAVIYNLTWTLKVSLSREIAGFNLISMIGYRWL